MRKALRGWADGARTRARLGEDGAALVTALMFMLILTMLGLASIMTSGTELMLSRNYRLEKLALANANAGVQEALARLDLPAGALVLGEWSQKASTADKDLTWPFGSLAEGGNMGLMNFTGVVSYRLEDALHNFAGYSQASPRVVGYSKDCSYQKSPIQDYLKAYPVYVIESTGRVKSGSEVLSSATVKVEVSRNTMNLNVESPLTVMGDLSMNGTVNLSGANDCGGASLPPYSVPSSSTVDSTGGALTFDPPTGDEAATYIDLASPENFLGMSKAEIQKLAQGMGKYYDESNAAQWATCPGEPSQPKDFSFIDDYNNEENPVIVYVKPTTEYTLPTGSQNYGILFVDGDLRSAGNAQWKGLIYVTGQLTAAAGTLDVEGGIMAGSAATLSGGVNVTYGCTLLDGIAHQAFGTKVINWQRIYN
ncbi:MAG TPA: PilX N-terminal domain-containing pilus assembly protein [Nitrospirota bacterium]|jgi:Tfp pilus assembly protein PilX